MEIAVEGHEKLMRHVIMGTGKVTAQETAQRAHGTRKKNSG